MVRKGLNDNMSFFEGPAIPMAAGIWAVARMGVAWEGLKEGHGLGKGCGLYSSVNGW